MTARPAGWMRTLDRAIDGCVQPRPEAVEPISARELTARDSVFAQLPDVCRAEVDALWVLAAAVGSQVELPATVATWAKGHRIAAPWLVSRLVDGLAHGATVDDLADPQLFWGADEIECHQRGQPVMALAEGRELAGHPIVRDWPPLHEIGADPANETLEQFLNRSRAHYLARAEVVNHADIERLPLTREQDRDGRWLLLNRVKRVSYARIAAGDLPDTRGSAERVRKAVTRLAAIVGLQKKAG